MERPEVTVRLPVSAALAHRMADDLEADGRTLVVSHPLMLGAHALSGRWMPVAVSREYLNGQPQHWVTLVWVA